jgi:hypothetical protein
MEERFRSRNILDGCRGVSRHNHARANKKFSGHPQKKYDYKHERRNSCGLLGRIHLHIFLQYCLYCSLHKYLNWMVAKSRQN